MFGPARQPGGFFPTLADFSCDLGGRPRLRRIAGAFPAAHWSMDRCLLAAAASTSPCPILLRTVFQ